MIARKIIIDQKFCHCVFYRQRLRPRPDQNSTGGSGGIESRLEGKILQPSLTTEAIKKLVEIMKTKACTANKDDKAQMVEIGETVK